MFNGSTWSRSFANHVVLISKFAKDAVVATAQLTSDLFWPTVMSLRPSLDHTKYQLAHQISEPNEATPKPWIITSCQSSQELQVARLSIWSVTTATLSGFNGALAATRCPASANK